MRKNQPGFTLIEILVIIAALVVITGGVLVWQKKVPPMPTIVPLPSSETTPTPPETTSPVHPQLEFSFKDCDEFVGSETREKLGVDEVRWLDSTTLLTEVFVSINCAEKMTGGDFEINGDAIVLKYLHTKCIVCTSCECIHELTYKFTNLEKKDYQFELSSVRK